MLLGHRKQIQHLKKIIESGRVSHAYLFAGQGRLGKKKVALEFISWIFGEFPLFHPDFFIIEPISSQIQIDQIRELNWKISLKPIKAKIKAAIIDQAHLMTKEAQNCFLKTLEEPKGNTLIILISEYPNLILPTLVSRCQMIKFFPVKNEEIENYLKEKGIEEKERKKILELALGKPGIAISLVEDRKKLKEFEKIEKDLEKIPQMSIADRFRYGKEILSKFNLPDILQLWISSLRKTFLHQPNLRIVEFMEEIQRIYFLISTTNLDQGLALENLLLKI